VTESTETPEQKQTKSLALLRQMIRRQQVLLGTLTLGAGLVAALFVSSPYLWLIPLHAIISPIVIFEPLLIGVKFRDCGYTQSKQFLRRLPSYLAVVGLGALMAASAAWIQQDLKSPIKIDFWQQFWTLTTSVFFIGECAAPVITNTRPNADIRKTLPMMLLYSAVQLVPIIRDVGEWRVLLFPLFLLLMVPTAIPLSAYPLSTFAHLKKRTSKVLVLFTLPATLLGCIIFPDYLMYVPPIVLLQTLVIVLSPLLVPVELRERVFRRMQTETKPQ